MNTLVVTGASGMLGDAVLRAAASKYKKVLAIHNSRPVRYRHPNVLPIKLDLRNKHEVAALFHEYRPDSVIHCAAKINLEECESNFSSALEHNVEVTHHLCESYLEYSDTPKPGGFVVISSDAVYPDLPLSVKKSEEIPVKPASAYGMTKLWSEQVAERHFPGSLIIRTTIVGGNSSQFVGWISRAVKLGQQIRLFDDVYFTPIAVTQAAGIIITAMENELSGTFNLGCSNAISKAQFGDLIISKLNPLAERTFGSLRDLQAKTARSFNMALNSEKLSNRLDIKMPSPQEVVEECLRLLKENQFEDEALNRTS